MKSKLEKLSKEDIICIIDNVINDMKSTGMMAQYNKYKEEIEDKIYCIKPVKAMEIVRNMRPYSEVFSMDTVKNMLSANGIPYDEKLCTKYYLCMNMYANDAKQVAEENNMPLEKFCFVMAKTFINDIDAGKYKVEKYFTDIAGDDIMNR